MPCCPVDGWWLHRCPTRTESNENSDHDRCFWWKITDWQRRVLNFQWFSMLLILRLSWHICLHETTAAGTGSSGRTSSTFPGEGTRDGLSACNLKNSRVNWGTHRKHCYHNAIWRLERCGFKWIAVFESQVRVCQYLYVYYIYNIIYHSILDS